MIRKIISGGQTGVDQAALDAAMDSGVACGGWLPIGRRTENGPLPEKYTGMEELSTESYPARTEKNIIESDATLILSRGPLSGGSALTARIARELGKPLLHVDLQKSSSGATVLQVIRWLRRSEADTLNVAGPRASSSAGIYKEAYAFVKTVLDQSRQ